MIRKVILEDKRFTTYEPKGSFLFHSPEMEPRVEGKIKEISDKLDMLCEDE
jgi:hypothetical protein